MNVNIKTKPEPVKRFLELFSTSNTEAIFIAAAVVGIGTGLGGVLFISMIEWIKDFLFNWLPVTFPTIGRGWILIAPIIGGLIAGPIIAFFAAEAKGNGIPEVMKAIAINRGKIRPQVVVAKVLASSACIGSGGSAGREGPIVQVGAALGSTIAQKLNFSESKVRNLVACGAAAGISATFNAPITGVLFAVEILLGELSIEGVGSILLSSVSASVITRAIIGDHPAFSIPFYTLTNPLQIFLHFLLGVAGAFVGVMFVKLLYLLEDKFDHWKFPNALKPAVGGLAVGIIGFSSPALLSTFNNIPADQLRAGLPIIQNIPDVYGSGYATITNALLGQMPIGLMFGLLILKILATGFTLGSGNSGGDFAPVLFMGAMAGGVFGWATEAIFPTISGGNIGLYAMVGMAAVFAAATRAPLTAILLVFEMTDNYRILVPLMAAVFTSTLIAEKIQKESIYTLKLVRKGIRLFRGRDVDVMSSVLAEEVMDKDPVTVENNMPLSELIDLFQITNSHGFPVLDDNNRLVGIVSLQDIHKVTNKDPENIKNLRVSDVVHFNLTTAFPDETISEVLLRMAPYDLSRIPIVDRDDPHKLIGVVRRNSIIRAYEIGLVRRGFAFGKLPGSPSGIATGKFFISENSPLIGKKLAALNLPESLLIIHIKRDRHIILPHGNTTLEAGDIVTVIARDGDTSQMEKFLNDCKEQKSEIES